MQSLPEPIQAFISELAGRDHSLKPQVEPGGEKAGNWWIDLIGSNRITIEWRPKQGFGFTIGKVKGFGEGPVEIFLSPARAAHRVMQLIGSQGNGLATAKAPETLPRSEGHSLP